MNAIATIQHPVILFDGVCNLCNNSVQFVIKHDKAQQFRFASLQSDFGEQVLKSFDLSADQFNSFILLEEGKIYTKSTAALRVAKRLNGLYKYLYDFMIAPKFIRDTVYNIIAKNRYKWFGKQESCWLPTPALQHLFLNDTVIETAPQPH
jgi:predicted DCC family thiol-disulfide oxidoreductase YuxK